jgi:hypothetical protein
MLLKEISRESYRGHVIRLFALGLKGEVSAAVLAPPVGRVVAVRRYGDARAAVVAAGLAREAVDAILGDAQKREGR